MAKEMADENQESSPKSAAPDPLRRKRKQKQRRRRRPFPRSEGEAAEGGERGDWPSPPAEGEVGEGPWGPPERGGRGKGRSGRRSRGGPRGRGGRGRPWRGRGGGPWGPSDGDGTHPWGPPGMEGGGEPWGALDGEGRGPWGPEADGMGGRPWDDRPPPDWERRGRGPPDGDGRHPWGPADEGMGGPPWGSPEMDSGPPPGTGGGPWGPSEEGMGGRPWGPSEMGDRPPPEREGRGECWAPPERGSRERSWGSPERRDWGHFREPPQRNGRGPPEWKGRGPSMGSPRKIMSPPRELWDPPPEGVWREPDPEMHQSSLPSSLGWEPHRGDLTNRWGGPIEEARDELPARGNQVPLRAQGPLRPRRARSESPAERRERSHPLEKLKRIRWDGPEGREGEQVIPSRRQVGQDSPEGLRRPLDPNRDSRAWREGSRDHGYSSRQLQLDPMGVAGQWSGPEEMEGEPPGPPRQDWGWDSPNRQRWQTGEERDCYSPRWEERQEHFKGQSPLDLDQGHGSLGGGRWSSSEQRGRGHFPTESPYRQRHPEGHLAHFQGRWGPKGGRVYRGDPERDWKKEEGHGGGGEDLDTKTFTASPATVSKEWTPCEQVLNFWARCRTVLKKKPRAYLLSTCPRPTLPDRSSETPELNSSITAMLKPQQQKEVAYATRSLHALQDEVLDMLAPAMTIYEMAEEALAKGEAVDPMELREWAQRLVRYIGSISQSLTLQRRVLVLGAIHPRLKCVTTKMTSQSTDGLLFAEDKVKLLKEIIKKFPQLAQTPQAPRRSHPFVSRRRAPVRSGPHHLRGAGKPYEPEFPPACFAADQHEENH